VVHGVRLCREATIIGTGLQTAELTTSMSIGVGSARMEVEPIAEGLWRWTARHPGWTPGQGWEPDVGCVYYEDRDAVVLIDPLVPVGEEERFWRALDRDVERLALPVAVLVTCSWHERSAAVVETRYAGARDAPSGVEAIPVAPEEVAFWLPEMATLVVGDVLVGAGDGLRLHREWQAEPLDVVIDAVARLAALPVVRVLPSHGSSVLEDGREALAHAHSSAATAT
jgi:glyoxylase-like metal-dependent hydrolase (beta-lactamase superfamily II)